MTLVPHRLPQEIIDKIFLMLDFNTLNNCRKLQSTYVYVRTQYSNIFDAVENNNIENLKWLISQKKDKKNKKIKRELYNGIIFGEYNTLRKNIENLQNVFYYLHISCDDHFKSVDDFEYEDLIFLLVCSTGNIKVELVKWLKQQDYYKMRIFKPCFIIIFALGYIEILEWMYATGCPIPNDIFSMIGYFAELLDDKTLSWLNKVKPPTKSEKDDCMIALIHKNCKDFENLLEDAEVLHEFLPPNYRQLLYDDWYDDLEDLSVVSDDTYDDE